MTKQTTYWHLKDNKEVSTYDLVTSKLHYHLEKGFEVNTPLNEWYEQYGRKSRLSYKSFAGFRDPRQTTYSAYVSEQARKEAEVDRILAAIDEQKSDRNITPEWMQTLDLILPQLRFVFHGFQMITAYVGSMAPDSRLTILCMFQSGDEMRRIERVAYRMKQMQATNPSFGHSSKEHWQRLELWQPLRKTLEELLVTYDWGEALVGLNLALKPMADQLFINRFALALEKQNDPDFAQFINSFWDDCQWQKEWTAEFKKILVTDPSNQQPLHEWTNKWQAKATAALKPFAKLIP